jgi:hypothetical protein
MLSLANDRCEPSPSLHGVSFKVRALQVCDGPPPKFMLLQLLMTSCSQHPRLLEHVERARLGGGMAPKIRDQSSWYFCWINRRRKERAYEMVEAKDRMTSEEMARMIMNEEGASRICKSAWEAAAYFLREVHGMSKCD